MSYAVDVQMLSAVNSVFALLTYFDSKTGTQELALDRF